MSPAVSSAIAHEHARTVEEVVVAVRIAGVHSEVPVAGVPVERTVEVERIAECPVLPAEQYVAQIEVALPPVCSV